MGTSMFERDLLYPTSNPLEPGSVHIVVHHPSSSGTMPVVIEPKTVHNPVDYLDIILQIIQLDVFDRIHLNVKASATLYLKGPTPGAPLQRIGFTDGGKVTLETVTGF